ncbi:biogenesis of lysosome-related organelles complex 1 subunit 4-like [Oscarella lobularis]|uniref:biogenesis of lysosome-related organelles complex 1 subunit 4-like n=1 Tax=Oscarella lobularis TaxID=121494 RepID=UPI0033138E37
MAEARADEPENVAEVAKTDSTVVEEELDVDLEALAKDFAALFRVDTTTKTKEMEKIIQDMLARLDEYYHSLERMRAESSNAFKSQIPGLLEKCDELKRVFDMIDQLERFLCVVKETVDQVEAKVQGAEKDLLVNPVKKFMKKIPPFLSRKKPFVPAKPKVERKWNAPSIFSCDEYFGKRKDGSSA